MLYHAAFLVSKGALEAAPDEETLGLCFGVITRLRVLHPPGCAGKVSVVVLYHGRQVFPLSSDAAFVGDGDPLECACSVPIVERPFEVVLRGWAPDASYDHTVELTFEVSSLGLAVPVPLARPVLPGV